jgi:hypothetical protein
MAAEVYAGLTAVLLEEAAPVIRSALRRKLRVSLRSSDQREQNLDALDLLGEVQLKLLAWLRKQEQPDAPQAARIDVKAYAATVTYHCCADYLRAKYPQRASLKNCLRRLLETRNGYAVWTAGSGELFCGFSGWPGTAAAPPAKISALQQDPDLLHLDTLPRLAAETLSGRDWLSLLEAIFDFLGAPVAMDDLLAIVAPLTGVQEWLPVYESGSTEEEGPSALDTVATQTPDPYSVRLTVERLQLYWGAVLLLLPWHRAAYLLNLREGDLDALPYYGVVSIEGIGEAIELKARQMTTLEQQVGVGPASGSHTRLGQRFAACWRFLPLEDMVIALVLEVTRPQVIGYRTKARERLARSLKALQ